MTPSHSKSYLPALTGLRGAAAILVFWYHARWMAGNPEIVVGAIDFRNVLIAMDGGVGIFFVLSGFLLSSPYWQQILNPTLPPIALVPYFIRRFLRIAPAYYISLIHTHLFSNLTYTFWGAVSLLLSILGLHTFFHQSYVWGINPVIWSIGIEIQFYVLLPILFICSKMFIRRFPKLKQNNDIVILYILTVVCFSLDPVYRRIALALAPYFPTTIFGGQEAKLSMVINNSVFYYLKWFWVGIGFSWLYQSHAGILTKRLNGKNHITFADLLTLVGLLGVVWIFLNASEGEWRSISLYGFPANCLFFGCLIISVPYSLVGKSLFENSIMIFIGEVSYGIYLWHWLIQVNVFQGSLAHYFNGKQLLLWGGIVSFLITLLIGSLSYFLVERPTIELARRCRSLPELWQEISVRFKY